jgi:hypothetical protein
VATPSVRGCRCRYSPSSLEEVFSETRRIRSQRMRSTFQISPKGKRRTSDGACLACYTDKRCPEAPLPCTASVTTTSLPPTLLRPQWILRQLREVHHFRHQRQVRP